MKIQTSFLCLLIILSSCSSSKQKEGISLNKTLNEASNGVTEGFECAYVFKGKDYRLNEFRVETEYKKLFHFTHERLKKHFTDNHFMEAYASTAKLGAVNYIYLKIFFNSIEVERSYGIIPKNENMRITLMNGETVYLETISSTYPNTSKKTGQTIYDGIFKANSSDIESLRNTEIDKLGIVWAHGFEEYEVSNIDLIKNQIKCLNQNSN
jgi:hypothetical protein